MGIKTYKDESGKIMVKGAPAGAWAIWVLASLVMIVNIPITLANPIVGIIVFIIMSLLFYISRNYVKVARGKAALKALEAEEKEKQLEQQKQKELEKQNKDKIEFEEFKKWKEQQADNQKKMKEESE
jgi:flagellar biosynthesis/type III secretory pathway M-ring protein FliF/YscJ